MISSKALATLFFIPLNMQRAAASSSSGTQIPSPSDKPTLKKKQGLAPKTREVLVDASNTVNDVEVQGENSEVINTSQELSVPQVNNRFKAFIEKGEYEKIFETGKEMNDEEFLRQLCPVIETLDQYKGVTKYLKGRKMVASFYIHGNIEVVKGAIIESKVYDKENYVNDGDLETALPQALKEDLHDRAIELLDMRKEITAERVELIKLEGEDTSFEDFVYDFLYYLSPWGKNGMTLRRFLILRGEELRNKYRDILDTLCEKLVGHLRDKLHFPFAKNLLVDLIGQPSLLTPVVFAKEFLRFDLGAYRSAFLKYGWGETIQEGLKSEYPGGGKELWRVMQEEQPAQFPGQFPETEEARAAACMHFPTKRQKEEEWIKNNATILCSKLKSEFTSSIFPDVLWSIIFEYAVSLVITWNLTTSIK